MHAAMDEAFVNRFTPFWEEMFFFSKIGIELNAAAVKFIFGRCEGEKNSRPDCYSITPSVNVLFSPVGMPVEIVIFCGGGERIGEASTAQYCTLELGIDDS